MGEKRFVVETVEITDCDTDVSRIVEVITDKEECYSYENLCDIAVLLNGKEATIQRLEKENEQLRQMIKENVFERYREGSLADLEFKAIAYDDIVKLEMSYESGPKVIVICRQGKKENVKSFCQMFIPFGVYYEIKELENER